MNIKRTTITKRIIDARGTLDEAMDNKYPLQALDFIHLVDNPADDLIYKAGYAISGAEHDDIRTFTYKNESIDIPAHHIMIELLDGREVADINRVREIAELYKTERV